MAALSLTLRAILAEIGLLQEPICLLAPPGAKERYEPGAGGWYRVEVVRSGIRYQIAEIADLENSVNVT